mgnify:CR=1 FL=1
MPITLAARATRSVTGSRCGSVGLLVVDRARAPAAHHASTSARDAFDAATVRRRIDAALEAMPGVGGEAEAP